uniref:Uncharacterized protein n=1 Tax=Pararge aegeria TaxID=116150 RepID=S4PCZ7_9NEOP
MGIKEYSKIRTYLLELILKDFYVNSTSSLVYFMLILMNLSLTQQKKIHSAHTLHSLSTFIRRSLPFISHTSYTLIHFAFGSIL